MSDKKEKDEQLFNILQKTLQQSSKIFINNAITYAISTDEYNTLDKKSQEQFSKSSETKAGDFYVAKQPIPMSFLLCEMFKETIKDEQQKKLYEDFKKNNII